MKGKFTLLLASLLISLTIGPFVEDHWTGEYFTAFLGTAIVFSGIYAMGKNRRHLIFAFSLGIPAFGMNWMDILLDRTVLFGQLAPLFQILFYFYITMVVLEYVLADERVTANTLLGAISGYLLLGITWATIFVELHELDPTAFVYDQPFLDGENVGVGSFRNFIYLSFTTLTTLGYGDIVPNSSVAKSFSVAEAVVGVLYMTIFVARLVGLHIAEQINQSQDRPPNRE